MKSFVWLSLFCLFFFNIGNAHSQVASENQGLCVGLDEAKQRLSDYLGTSPVDTITMDFPFIAESEVDKMSSVAPSALLGQILQTLRFDATFSSYQTETAASGYCAAAAECWGWYVVSCQGEVEARADGED